MLPPGLFRQRIAATLNAAYGDGLLSENTLAHRLDVLLESRVIDPSKLIGDLTIRSSDGSVSSAFARAVGWARERVRRPASGRRDAPSVLALDWTGAVEELLLGRDPSCDIVLTDPAVPRRHARLRFRDGNWVLQDLRSRNGTFVNESHVVRCQLRPGDHVLVGDQRLLVD